MLTLLVLAFSCSKEEAVPVSVDFTATLTDNDYSVPVTVQIFNRTTGAESYQWTFEGADRTSSTDRNPGTLVYDTPGSYTVRLDASNSDGSEGSKEFAFITDAAVEIGFMVEIQTNNFAPATVLLTNTTKGATTFQWAFEGGDPASSNEERPGDVVFGEPGEHRIKLMVGNGREIHELEKTITVGPDLLADFDWEVAFGDDDLQVPVTLTIWNKSEGVLDYDWDFNNGQPANSTQENPTVTFTEAGLHTLVLKVSNGKGARTVSKSVEVFANTNLRTFTDVRLGINTVHDSDTTGAFFSTVTREVYTKTEAGIADGSLIDIVFFGLGADFSFNKFVSPDEVATTTFETVPNAQYTIFINSQEQCGCTASLSTMEFDAMVNDEALSPLVIEETEGGLQHFTDEVVPRIVLFQTQDGRKGAIKIKEYVNDGQNSYINTDIKIQKQPD